MNFFTTPIPATTTTTTTTTPSTIPIASTNTVTAAKPVTRTYRDFERLLTKWQADFDTKHRLSYETLSQSVRQRDIDLSTYRETLQCVQRDINQMQLQQNHLQDELKLLDTHERELESNILRLENEILQLPPLQQDIYAIQQQNLYYNQQMPLTFNERTKNFQLLEQLDSLVKCSTKDLQDIVDKMNERDNDDDQDIDVGSTINTHGDVTMINEQNIKQLTKTLDSCFKMLSFVDTNVTDIDNKLAQISQRLFNS
jgi:chromosome segregation ATPase